MFEIRGTWYITAPRPVAVKPPQTLKPSTTRDYVFEIIGWLAEGGLYTLADIKRMFQRILFPMERDATVSNLAQRANGYDFDLQGAKYIRLVDADGLKQLADGMWEHIWGGFINFATASAGVLGVFLCIRAVKLTIDTAIHGFALHRVYGFSLYLLGAIWDSVTNLLLHLGRYPTPFERNHPRNRPGEDNDEAGVPLNRTNFGGNPQP